MQRQDYRFFHRLRVRWAEVDMQKIVFNAHYLMYFDTAISGYWRAMALPYEEAMHSLDGDLYVKKASVEYHGSARYDDTLEVGLKCARIGNSSIAFVGGIFRGDTLLISSELIYVFADPRSQTSRPVPQPLRDILLAFERGDTMLEVKTGPWQTLSQAAQDLRTAVFVQEQQIPPEQEWDSADAASTTLHAVAYNRLDQAVGTGRLLPDKDGSVRIGRMAVNRVLRGAGVGRALMQTLEKAAQQRGANQVLLHAQRSAEPFYRSLGYAPHGEPFEEAGIAHIGMHKGLG